jgi:transcriptional regulator with XRE-family HTH domain
MRDELTVAQHIGRNVHDLRRAAGLTQGDLADAMAEIGFGWHRGVVADVETGARELTVSELVAVAAYFELPVWVVATSVGGSIDTNAVDVAERPLSWQQWREFWTERRDHTQPSSNEMRKAIDALTGRLRRPWARIWRRDGGSAATAYERAWWDSITRRPFPGPTFIATEPDVQRSTHKRPWGQSVLLELQPDEPFVARDEFEREQLEDLERLGLVRRITPQQAYKLRRKKERGK